MVADHYRTLGVLRHATQAEIERAYRDLARRFHPDLNPNDEQARERFLLVQTAFDAMKDAPRRAEYDLALAQYEAALAASIDSQFPGADPATDGGKRRRSRRRGHSDGDPSRRRRRRRHRYSSVAGRDEPTAASTSPTTENGEKKRSKRRRRRRHAPSSATASANPTRDPASEAADPTRRRKKRRRKQTGHHHSTHKSAKISSTDDFKNRAAPLPVMAWALIAAAVVLLGVPIWMGFIRDQEYIDKLKAEDPLSIQARHDLRAILVKPRPPESATAGEPASAPTSP